MQNKFSTQLLEAELLHHRLHYEWIKSHDPNNENTKALLESIQFEVDDILRELELVTANSKSSWTSL